MHFRITNRFDRYS